MRALLPFVVVSFVLASVVGPVRGQPSLTGESALVLAPGPQAVAAGGATVAFAPDVFSFVLQPAALAASTTAAWGWTLEHERFPLEGASQWNVATRIPLQRLDPHLPAIAVSHRRLRADVRYQAQVLGLSRGIAIDVATDVTSLGAGWDLPIGAQSGLGLGVALHVVESGGELRSENLVAPGDTVRTTITGLDDLLFSTTLGAVVRRRFEVGAGSTLEARIGGVLRRVGEESRALASTIDLTNLGAAALADLGLGAYVNARPSMASELAFGAGARWRARGVGLTAQIEMADPLYARAPDGVAWRAGAELALLDVVHLRAGGIDDARGRDAVFGAAVRAPLGDSWSVEFGIAHEPQRIAPDLVDDAWIVGVELRGALPRGGAPDGEERGIEELLDSIDEWLDEPSDEGDGGRS